MILPIIQIILSVALIIAILLQQRGEGLSTIFGGGGTYHTKRGVEKGLYMGTIILGVLFVLSSIAALITQ